MIAKNYQPYILEINKGPSLKYVNRNDMNLKKNVLTEFFKLGQQLYISNNKLYNFPIQNYELLI